MKHGRGTYKWADGQMYDGEWNLGKQHGNGVHISLDGCRRHGVWKNGKREKWLTEAERDSAQDFC
jgi:hypothetical protein